MEIRRNTAEKQVMEETGGGERRGAEGREGRKERRVVEGSWIMRTLMRGLQSPE